MAQYLSSPLSGSLAEGCTRITVPGLTREDIHALVGRLVSEGLLECPHRDGPEVSLTPEAVTALTDAENR